MGFERGINSAEINAAAERLEPHVGGDFIDRLRETASEEGERLYAIEEMRDIAAENIIEGMDASDVEGWRMWVSEMENLLEAYAEEYGIEKDEQGMFFEDQVEVVGDISLNLLAVQIDIDQFYEILDAVEESQEERRGLFDVVRGTGVSTAAATEVAEANTEEEQAAAVAQAATEAAESAESAGENPSGLITDIIEQFTELIEQLKEMLDELLGPILAGFGGGSSEEEPTNANNPESLDEMTSDNLPERTNASMQSQLESHEYINGIVTQLEGNSGRDVAIATTDSFDPQQPIELIYHFHGMNSHDPDHDVDGSTRFDYTLSTLENSGRNAVLIYPLSEGPTGGARSDMEWMGEPDDFGTMHQEVLGLLAENGVDAGNARVIAEGHSAGGQALREIAESGNTDVDRFVFLDASYGAWASDAYNAMAEHYGDQDFDMQVFFIQDDRGDRTDNDATRSLIGRDNVTHYVMNPGGGVDSISHGGSIEEFFGGAEEGEHQDRVVNYSS